MFTGIVEEIGRVRRVRPIGGGREIWIDCSRVLDDLAISDSIAVDGVCQTVTAVDGRGFAVQALGETLEKTTLSRFGAAREVNLERSLRPGDRIGGHFVQGHVQATGSVVALTPRGDGYLFAVEVAEGLGRYIVREGSIAVDGVSLTIASWDGAVFTVNLIPFSAGHTTLGRRTTGDDVNIEVDIIGRYVERFLARSGDADTRGAADLSHDAKNPTENPTGIADGGQKRTGRERPGKLSLEQLSQWGYQ